MEEDGLKRLLTAAEDIARRAGAEIMKRYEGTTVYTKSDGSNVTDADYAAESVILPALRELTPDIPIVSEERVAHGEIPDISKGTFWTVDPLDGTHEFINKTGAFVVAIALVVDGKAVMGIVYHPAMELMYSGRGPGTATKVGDDGIRTPLVARETPGSDMRFVVNGPHADMTRIKGYLSTHFRRSSARIDDTSGILRACQVADGLADGAIVYADKRNGRTAFWDVAPGHAIIESAGGRVEALDGKPLVYNAEDLQVPPHIVISAQQAKKLKANKADFSLG